VNFDDPIEGEEERPPRPFTLKGKEFVARRLPTVDSSIRFSTFITLADCDDPLYFVKVMKASQEFILDMLMDDEQRNTMDLMFSSILDGPAVHRLFTWIASDED
jgi:hypothetical protein